MEGDRPFFESPQLDSTMVIDRRPIDGEVERLNGGFVTGEGGGKEVSAWERGDYELALQTRENYFPRNRTRIIRGRPRIQSSPPSLPPELANSFQIHGSSFPAGLSGVSARWKIGKLRYRFTDN